MKEYFHLQIKMLNRKMLAFGIPIVLGYVLSLIVFVLGSYFLFLKTEFAVYIYFLIALSFISQLSETNRNDFLKSIFKKSAYHRIRVVENLILVSPFLLFLVYKGYFKLSLVLLILSAIISLFHFKSSIQFTIPTPFFKKPFEFVIGFRKSLVVIILAYLIALVSIVVGNFNLGAFSVLLIAIVCISFYAKPENEYFVWNYSLTAKQFLLEKAKACVVNFTLLCLPVLLALGIVNITDAYILLILYFTAVAYLITVVLAKYSAYPNEMNLPQVILMAISLLMPPMLIVIAPIFYSKSIKKLNTLLA